MQNQGKNADPLEVLPNVPINLIARKVGISQEGVKGSAGRLGVQIVRTATGRAEFTPRTAVQIIEELRDRRLARSAE